MPTGAREKPWGPQSGRLRLQELVGGRGGGPRRGMSSVTGAYLWVGVPIPAPSHLGRALLLPSPLVCPAHRWGGELRNTCEGGLDGP